MSQLFGTNASTLTIITIEKIKTNDFHITRKRTTKNFNQPGEMKLLEREICMAVFCLSPVSIQKCIPAFLKV
jgi:hypothetical protein